MRPVIGVVVGNVFDLLISNVLGFIILILLAYNFFCCEVSEGDARERIETLSTSSQFLVLSFFGGALVSLFSGYLAAFGCSKVLLTQDVAANPILSQSRPYVQGFFNVQPVRR